MSNGSAPLLNIFRSLQNNRISGQIPPEIGKLANLNALDLSGNQFVGDIPSSLGQLTRLNYLSVDVNPLLYTWQHIILLTGALLTCQAS
jgi:hypothetical protein